MKPIFVSQGHPQGVGLEIFFKAISLLSRKELKQLHLVGSKEILDHYPKASITYHYIDGKLAQSSFASLEMACDLVQKTKGILFTLPTSKDQFPNHAGHTEFFRYKYKEKNLGMYFRSKQNKVLLLSDHIPVSQIASLDLNMIKKKIEISLTQLLEHDENIKRVLISGINPHAGEKGMMGNEDKLIELAITHLQIKFPKIVFKGPLAADSMILSSKKTDLMVYTYHDQGLGVFKALNSWLATHLTLGLPFWRFSVDHGTAFDLVGKNTANYAGCLYVLRDCLFFSQRGSLG